MNIIKTDQIKTCYDRAGNIVEVEENNKCDSMSNTSDVTNTVFYTADGMRFEFPGIGLNSTGGKDIKYLHESGLSIGYGTFYPHNKGVACYGNRCYENASANGMSGFCGSYGLANNPSGRINIPCLIMVDVNGDKKPNPPHKYDDRIYDLGYMHVKASQDFEYSYAMPTDKKLTDIFSILITDEKAIPFGVVAQRAMYSK